MAPAPVPFPLPPPSGRGREVSLSRFARIALSASLLVTLGFVPSLAAGAEEKTAPDVCGAPVIPESPETKHINLVVDDSGSMFRDAETKQLLDRWSFAKYSLEVFAALMGSGDSLDVYLLSSFARDGNRQASISLQGRQTQLDIDRIRTLQFEGSGTPYEAVTKANDDLSARTADQNWLVILTDGEFREDGDAVATARVQQDLESFLESQQDGGSQFGIAFLALGNDAPNLTALTQQGLVFAQAENSRDLLTTMGSFANRIFGRNKVEVSSAGNWSSELDLEEVIVFAQGPDVEIGAATTSSGGAAPQSIVEVSWADNKVIGFPNGDLEKPLANRELQGQIATFGEIPRGDIGFDISNAETVELFYRPKVNFGARLTNEAGQVEDTTVVAGPHTLDFGFLSDCEFVNDSPLLSAGNFAASVYQDGDLVAEDLRPGDQVELQDGEVTLEYSATYLDGVPEVAEQTFTVAKPPFPSRMTAVVPEYKVTEMAEFPPPARQIAINYEVIEDETPRQPLPEEWAALDPQTFEIASESNLEFQLVKEETPGQLRLLLRAPDGDIYDANVGDLEATVRGSYLPVGNQAPAEVDVPISVEDDRSWWDKFLNWFKEIGWKILLALLLLALILGYIFKRRFSKRVKRRPSITGTPRSVGVTPIEDRGKFQASGFRKFLPFVANTATLSYVPPGTIGFRAMKLKAGPRKSMTVTNWKEIAEKDNVEINGTPLNSETRRPPKLSASGTISASTPQMTYEMTPST